MDVTDTTTLAPAPEAPEARTGSLLQSLPHDVVLRAKHIISHLLLPDGATVIDLECETGALTAALAAFNPRLNFIGIDRNRQMIMRARARFKQFAIPNLNFETGDTMGLRRGAESVDAIVASNVVGQVYTRSNYDDTRIADVLEKQFALLKTDGLLVIYDYAMPPTDEYVQIEFPVPVRDQKFFRLYAAPVGKTQGERETEMLEWFSANARARDTVKGFYLEELPAHVPYTRLYRLPAKWAYEFIIRKQQPRKFKAHIGHQYTCLTESDFDRILGRVLGARVVYTAPWQQAHIVQAHFEGSFRLYTADGKPRGYPPTGYVVVAQKVASGQSLKVQELRPSAQAAESLAIQAVRDDRNGEVVDIVSRDVPRVDVIPYFLTPEGRLKVVLRAGADKGIANLARARNNLDGKRWSGHMVAAANLTVHDLEGFDHASHAAVARLMVQQFGLKPLHAKSFVKGPRGFPSPSMIDERLDTLFIEIQPPQNGPRLAGPIDLLRLRTFDAEDILRATGAGFIPSAWLDIQMQSLMKQVGLKVSPWLHEALPLGREAIPEDQMIRADKILRQKPAKDGLRDAGRASNGKGVTWPRTAGAFRPIRGRAGQVATMRSSFVEQGRVDGAIRGMSAHDMDFAFPQSDLQNIAAVLPLTQDLGGNTLIGFELKELPVPSRYGQEAPMMNLPTLPLPASVTSMDEARAYIAEQFDVELKRVAPMGESFYTFVDMMPQRVFPFALTQWPKRRNAKMRLTTLDNIKWITDPDFSDSILWQWGLAQALLCHETGHMELQTPRHEAGRRLYGPSAPRWESGAGSEWSKAAQAGNDSARKSTTRLHHRRNKPT